MQRILGLALLFLAPVAAMAEGGVTDKGYYAIGAGIVLGLAALGGTSGQGKVGAAAMEGIARNPQAVKALNTPMILSLALIESLVILSFLIAFFLNNKI
jgi:F-type H+-transporting ATPase subunit c